MLAVKIWMRKGKINKILKGVIGEQKPGFPIYANY